MEEITLEKKSEYTDYSAIFSLQNETEKGRRH